MTTAGTCRRLIALVFAGAVIAQGAGMARAALFPIPARTTPSASPPGPPPVPSASLAPPTPSIIRRVDNSEMKIAITFDACATNGQANGFDRPVLRVLQREQVPATIFTSGRWVESHPAAMTQLIAEPLIEFANHSFDHPHMSRLSVDDIGAEIDRTEAALAQYGRRSVAFRPPFGDFDDRVLAVARDKQIPAVLWDVVSGDPSAAATAEGITRTVVRKTRAGSIVIFHINARETKTAAALPAIFRQLRARGFEFVHLSDLLATATPAKIPADAVAKLPGPRPDDGIMPLEDMGPALAPPSDSGVEPPPFDQK